MWNKWNYLCNRIRNMDVHAMRDAVSTVHERSGKVRLFILLDMVWCGLRYGAGYMDYLLFEMETLSARQRATYLTRGASSRLVASLNAPEYRVNFSDKRKFNALFSGMLGREYLDLETAGLTEFLRFIKDKSCFIAKPPSGTGGLGVEKIEVGSADPVALYDALQNSRHVLLEECILQHPALARLHPESVNTCRIVTLLHEGRVQVITAFLRIGNGGAVDNFHSHGLVTKLEPVTGTALYDPVDRDGRVYPLHPQTGVKIKGVQVPYWEQALEMVSRCAPVVPQIRYVGWDVAITPDGPVLIEGNEFPGHDLYQLPALTPQKIGILPQFEKILTTCVPGA